MKNTLSTRFSKGLTYTKDVIDAVNSMGSQYYTHDYDHYVIRYGGEWRTYNWLYHNVPTLKLPAVEGVTDE